VLPKKMRDAMGLKPGDEVDFEFDGVAVRVVAAGPPADWQKWRGSLSGDVWEAMADDREIERRHEAELEALASGRRRRRR
jgi:AbrB family looped-hinge helix DNA binding protein